MSGRSDKYRSTRKIVITQELARTFDRMTRDREFREETCGRLGIDYDVSTGALHVPISAVNQIVLKDLDLDEQGIEVADRG